ncbi:hypothetical protein [sulfur-oxidizing endosymbiont of Gigantopelta aegis]|uniref:hypothetical protein n=1 Tax=sulfur-oxidizing endosymbiont of Gigantopelta aegis TaxID=2794934 RepID=UPI0018DB459F|nr:hypothetical protein [sulfur-oxidizing endosymbiont of Gigantopelta aegis]
MKKILSQHDSLNKELIHTIDQLIMDTGNYQAIELLLALSLLRYSDYEQWRMGKIQYLVDIIDHRQNDIINILEQAEAYVCSLKLVAEPLSFPQWEVSGQNNTVAVSANSSTFSDFLSKQYLRVNHDDQMDLFFDNQALNIINDLKRALISRNIQMASKKFQALYDIEPQNKIIAPAKTLLDALVNALEEEQISDPNREMDYLLNELAPLACSTLAGQERDYMALFWRRLARYINDATYHEKSLAGNNFQLHSSVCYTQIPDWQAVIESIENTPEMGQHQELLSRYAIAFRHSGQTTHYHQALCQYYWQFIDKSDNDNELINDDSMLKKIWQQFLDQELDKAWGINNFTCWLLIKIPGIAHHIKTNNKTPETFELLQNLLLTEINTQEACISLRKRLQETEPDMLKHYLKTQGV